MGTLLHSSAVVREPIKLSFRVVSGVGQGMGVLDGGGDHRREGAVLGCKFGPSH